MEPPLKSRYWSIKEKQATVFACIGLANSSLREKADIWGKIYESYSNSLVVEKGVSEEQSLLLDLFAEQFSVYVCVHLFAEVNGFGFVSSS